MRDEYKRLYNTIREERRLKASILSTIERCNCKFNRCSEENYAFWFKKDMRYSVSFCHVVSGLNIKRASFVVGCVNAKIAIRQRAARLS